MSKYAVDLQLELLSPCFMGGAFQQPEFRIGSLRGLWRYWYRALYGSGTETSPTDEEQLLFGGVSRAEDAQGRESLAGRGKARLILSAPVEMLEGKPWARGKQPSGADYLVFSMPMNQRRYLEPPFKVSLQLHVGGSNAEFDRAARSLAAALSFSGIGARARRLAGAVHLSALEAKPPYFFSTPATDPESLAARIQQLLAPALGPGRKVDSARYHVIAPRYFSAGVVKKPLPTPNWGAAMEAVGDAFREFRQFEPGTNRRRQPDYAVAKDALRGRAPVAGKTITRAAFGLPIRFRFNSEGGKTVQAELPAVGNMRRDRRGSPFLLTLEKLGDGRLAVVWCLFRSPLSPSGKIRIGEVTASAPDFGLVDEMLGRQQWDSYKIAG
jgi:hypothetical protein